jgi:hypothetical protein
MNLPDPPEPQPGFGTPDRPVRRQIDAVKEYLTMERLTPVEEPLIQPKAFEGFHTLVVRHEGTPRFLRLSYAWLADHPTDVGAWAQAHAIARRLKEADDYEITIHEHGTIVSTRST